LEIEDERQGERHKDQARLKPEEMAVLALLEKRLSRTLKRCISEQRCTLDQFSSSMLI